MKKILAISIALLYLAISSGLVLTVHYCMGKKVGSSVRLTEKEDHVCGSCGMKPGKNNCCNDEVKLIKVEDQQKQVDTNYHFETPAAPEPEYNLARPGFHLMLDAEPVSNHSPPDTGQPSPRILYCIFRI